MSSDRPASPSSPKALAPIDAALFKGVTVAIEARLGQTEMTIDSLMSLRAGSTVILDESIADHVDLYVNGVVVARGEIVAVDDRFAVRIVELAAT
jgi:flagellar motor switch protein FliN/FliY